MTITCAWCGRHYDAFAKSQANGCAASVWKKDGRWYLQGHYGSRHDTTRFVFAVPPAGRADPVCDDCIDARLRSEELSRVAGSFL